MVAQGRLNSGAGAARLGSKLKDEAVTVGSFAVVRWSGAAARGRAMDRQQQLEHWSGLDQRRLTSVSGGSGSIGSRHNRGSSRTSLDERGSGRRAAAAASTT
ncbi:hypothetical protein NL676_023452 [Syzygium grande]|nr:hypothetical protein NL676_023452 [Syzygium grande]